MATSKDLDRRGEHLKLLTETSAGTLMGTLLRSFWQPIVRSEALGRGKARAVRVLGEDLTLFRGESGHPFLVAGRCAHRCTVLHTGWVQGDDIRCMYHGWKYAGRTGQCTEMPAERPGSAESVKITAYPLHEYCGLIFAYMGQSPVPEFELPRKEVLERPGYVTGIVENVWDCNWFQQIENSLDALHVSFVHVWGSMSRFGEEISTAIPQLSYAETSAGLRQIATRSENNVRISDWTFPNNNHVVSPGPQKGDPWIHISGWAVPIDDERTLRFIIYAFASTDERTDRRILHDYTQVYDPVARYGELFGEQTLPQGSTLQLLQAQDYAAVRGQGTMVNRMRERLGQSDAGIALLRKTFFRELDAIRAGRPTKEWRALEGPSDLPIQVPESASA